MPNKQKQDTRTDYGKYQHYSQDRNYEDNGEDSKDINSNDEVNSSMFERVKNFLTGTPRDKQPETSSTVPLASNLIPTQDDMLSPGFFDDARASDIMSHNMNSYEIETGKINTYRNLSMQTNVQSGIEEIVREIVFNSGHENILKLNVDTTNTELDNAVHQAFDKTCRLIGVNDSIFYNIVKQTYIDGQCMFHCAYVSTEKTEKVDKTKKDAQNNLNEVEKEIDSDKEKDKEKDRDKDPKNKTIMKGGIQKITLIDPTKVKYDINKGVWTTKNASSENSIFAMHKFQSVNAKHEYDFEEIVNADFGMRDQYGVRFGYLEYAIKPANQLQTLEDLLIPMRFSRSVSRRVFNIDTGDTPPKRSKEIMNEYQQKFRYKKHYNTTTGEIKNNREFNGMVEDYWFNNRGGNKGTTVDVLDETGNLGELGDIIYFSKKLYQSMNVPSNRILHLEGEFDFTSSQVDRDEMRFFSFLTRLRSVYIKVIKEVIRRELISTGSVKDSEWAKLSELITITFSHENTFIDKMRLDNLDEQMNIFSNASELIGKVFSAERVIQDIFKMSPDELAEEQKKIKEEKSNDAFSQFYPSEDENNSRY